MSRENFVGACLLALLSCASADAATIDTTTQGNWIGTYGSEGYALFDYGRAATNSNSSSVYDASASTANDVISLPAGSPVSSYVYSSGFQQYLWMTNQTDVRDLQNPADPAGFRNAATSFTQTNGADQTITINLNGPANFQLAVYALDWDRYQGSTNGRDITLSVGSDSAQVNNVGAMGEPTNAYNSGTWILFDINDPTGAPVVLDLHQNNSASASNATLSAIAFDPIPEPATASVFGIATFGALLRRRKA